MELVWQPSVELSAIHAAHCVAEGRPLINAELTKELAQAASDLSSFATEGGIRKEVFWRNLLTLAHDQPNSHELVGRVLQRSGAGDAATSLRDEIVARLAECKAVMRRVFPRLAEELPLRISPLQIAWETRGPGLLFMIRKLTEPGFVVESATVLLVQPVVGGDGMAHLETNRVHFEALLTDVDPRLPETLRLAWLLGQLQVDKPIYGEQMSGLQLHTTAARALIPVVLAAAEEVQLSSCTPEMIQLALRLWMRVPEHYVAGEQESISAWWETQAEAQFEWRTALAALAQMCP